MATYWLTEDLIKAWTTGSLFVEPCQAPLKGYQKMFKIRVAECSPFVA